MYRANYKRRAEGVTYTENTINLFNAYGLKSYGAEGTGDQSSDKPKKVDKPRDNS